MAKILLSAFADEYSNNFDKQIEYLGNNDIKYTELRFLDGKNIADIDDNEAKEVAKKIQNSSNHLHQKLSQDNKKKTKPPAKHKPNI